MCMCRVVNICSSNIAVNMVIISIRLGLFKLDLHHQKVNKYVSEGD